MKVDKVKTSSIFNNYIQRFDANFHLSDGMLAKKQISISPHPLSNIKEWSDDVFYGGRSRRVYVEDVTNGIPFGGITCMLQSGILDTKFLSKKYSENLNSLFVQKGWILIARSGSGAIGTAQYVNENLSKVAISEHVIRVIPKKNVLSGFLYAYLASKTGYNLIRSGIFGSAIPHIEPHHVKDLPVPVLPESKQRKIHELIIEASSLRDEAFKLLRDAGDLFNDGLKLNKTSLVELTKPLEKRIQNSYSFNISNISAWTLRGRNYSPRKRKIVKLLSSGIHSRLRDVLKTDPYYGARYKRIESFSKSSVELLSQSDLFDLIPKGRSISKRSIKNLEQEIVSSETILVPAQGTLGENEIFGRARYVWGYLEDKVIAGHAMRFVPDTSKIPSGYLFTVLNSSLWFRLFRNTVYGTNLLGFIVPLLNELPIPRFEEREELKIDSMVKTAYDKLTMANKSEIKAIRFVEKEIESWQKS